MTYMWANPERTGILDMRSSVPRYIDSGPEFTAASALALPYVSPRQGMKCTRRQARLALGEANCAALDQAADDPNIPWAMRESIKSATEWYREAPEIDELAWLLGLDSDEIDSLFIKAMSL